MDSNGKLVKEGIEEAFPVEVDEKEERVFKVGELVEYWAGAFVRGYQTSGEPAFVKRVEGGGKYTINPYRTLTLILTLILTLKPNQIPKPNHNP